MGCCFFVIAGFLWPRIALVLIWLFDPKITHVAFTTWVLPLLGFFLLPTTTLAYELARYWAPGGKIEGVWLIVVAAGFLHDLLHVSAAMRSTRR